VKKITDTPYGVFLTGTGTSRQQISTSQEQYEKLHLPKNKLNSLH
jgi:hypothetical protein